LQLPDLLFRRLPIFYFRKGAIRLKNTIISCSKLAEKKCANFIDRKCLGENRCPVFNGTINPGFRCTYFEKSVLPDDPQLQETYSIHIVKQDASYSSKRCKGCNKIFKTNNYRLQYCGDGCKDSANRKAQIKYNAKR
jgi:hypothetical protein